MDSIATARDFFINQQGMSPDQADMLVSQGLQAYNQQAQPQSMMQMAGGGIARLGYQMGGLSTMSMDTGAPLQIPQQQQQPSFSSAQSITMNPLLNYGQPQLGSSTPLMMQGGGIARLGYQTGGVTLPSQGSELSQMQGMDQQQALQTIIQILIENGIPPEQAQELALQIIQIFAQGGAPAVEAFADQLEQEEVQAMAGGGIAGYAYRQGYGFGGIGKIFKGAAKAVSGVVKGVAKAVKSVAKSPIGRAALTIAAATFLGPGAFGIQGLGLTGAGLGFATAGANLGLQALGGQKLNLLEAGLSGFSAGLSNPTVPASSATSITTSGVDAATGNLGQAYANTGVAPLSLTGGTGELIAPTATSLGQTPLPIGNLATTPPAPTFFETAKAVAMDPSISGIKALAQQGLTGVEQYVQDEPYKALGIAAGAGSLATLGSQLGVPRNEGEDDASYAKRLEEAQGYITQYGRNLQIRNPYFYQREGAVNPFAPTMAANGGIMGYAKGGSMVPPARQIEGGIIELDARKTGGYIPYGKKERVDDVPAMLAKDEFVFTSRAVKAAGGGSARQGAAKMYKLMKQLEAKGKKMERGART